MARLGIAEIAAILAALFLVLSPAGAVGVPPPDVQCGDCLACHQGVESLGRPTTWVVRFAIWSPATGTGPG